MKRLLLAAGLTAALLAGCNTSSTATPNGAGASPLLRPGSGSLGPGDLPTGSPVEGGALNEAEATIEVTGDISASSRLIGVYGLAYYAPPPNGTIALGFVGADPPQSLLLAGRAALGDNVTSETLTLELTVSGGADATASFRSAGGECTVTIATAELTHVAGTFACAGLTSARGDVTIDASGSFDAAG